MTTSFPITSSDARQLEQATQVAETFARQYHRDGMVGIVFLGAIARGYFDHNADIDVALFKTQGADIPLPPNYQKIQGFEIHCHAADFEDEVIKPWDMSKRWAFSYNRIDYDPQGLISRLLQEKVPLKAEEKRWLMIEGITQSDWYINTLTQVWVERGNLISAHHMFAQGLDHLMDVLFGLNNQLVADVKWRYYCAERLPLLPPGFHNLIQEILITKAFTVEEVERRKRAFLEMWQYLLPLVEQEVQMTYEEFGQLV